MIPQSSTPVSVVGCQACHSGHHLKLLALDGLEVGAGMIRILPREQLLLQCLVRTTLTVDHCRSNPTPMSSPFGDLVLHTTQAARVL
jgi:hypothetical protein